MKILSIMTIAAGGASEPPGQSEMEAMGAFMAELRSKGGLVDTGGRTPEMLELIVTRKKGGTTIVDGPFSEAKEVVGGFALLDVEDRAEAIAVTNRFLDIMGDATCHLHEVGATP